MSIELTVAQQEMRDIVAEDKNALLALGLEFLSKDDKRIRPARLKIAHEDDPDIGKSGVKAGEFYNAKTGVVYGNSLDFTFLHFVRKTRAEYKIPYEKDAPLLCGSEDGLVPRKNDERRPLTEPKPGPCATCDSAQWEDADGTKRPKPPCSEQHNFMLNVDVGEGAWDKVLLMLQKTRVLAANILRELGQGAMYKRYLFTATKRVKSESGNFYVPVFSFGERLTPEQSVDTIFLARASHAAYTAGEIYIGADEDEGENGNANPHAPTAEEIKMPWDADPDVVPQVAPDVVPQVAPDQPQAPPVQSNNAPVTTQPPMPEPPPPDF